MSAPILRCADTARERDDPPIGTAPLTRAFLLIEHPGPWRSDALAGAGWSGEVVDALTAAVRSSHGRILFIRRPGRRQVSERRTWGVTRVGVGTAWGSWEREADLLTAAAALEASVSGGVMAVSGGAVAESPAGPVSTEPVLLVCAHGLHDTCCAVRGRPVATALAGRWPAATWECSHVGGDRFAANVVVLPDGTYYGGLGPDSATEVVAGHLDGHLDPVHLRGSVRWPPAAQAAVAAVHASSGPYAADDVRAERWTTEGPSRWRVEVTLPPGRQVAVAVVGERRPAAHLTCAARRATAAVAFRVLSIDPI